MFLQLEEVIRELNINYSIIKGEPLSYLAYGIYGKRDYKDIDILIDKASVKNVRNLLLSHGFSQNATRRDEVFTLISSHQLKSFVRLKKYLFN